MSDLNVWAAEVIEICAQHFEGHEPFRASTDLRLSPDDLLKADEKLVSDVLLPATISAVSRRKEYSEPGEFHHRPYVMGEAETGAWFVRIVPGYDGTHHKALYRLDIVRKPKADEAA